MCGAGQSLRLAAWAAHRGEEPPISGTSGSGTVFTSYCPLKCRFCQNFPFSQLGNGRDISVREAANHLLALQKQGVHNINFVNPTHFVPLLFEALMIAREQGLDLPVVYNTSGYERPEVLELLDGLVDIYLPDIRYADNECGRRFSGVPDYVEVDRKAIVAMDQQVGGLQMDSRGIGVRGLIVRHLVMPGGIAGSRDSLTWLRGTIGPAVHLSVMNQYFPAYQAFQTPGLERKITSEEYADVLELVDDLGFINALAQDPFETGGA